MMAMSDDGGRDTGVGEGGGKSSTGCGRLEGSFLEGRARSTPRLELRLPWLLRCISRTLAAARATRTPSAHYRAWYSDGEPAVNFISGRNCRAPVTLGVATPSIAPASFNFTHQGAVNRNRRAPASPIILRFLRPPQPGASPASVSAAHPLIPASRTQYN